MAPLRAGSPTRPDGKASTTTSWIGRAAAGSGAPSSPPSTAHSWSRGCSPAPRISTADERKIASNVFTLRLVSGAVFFGLAPILALAFPYPPDVQTAIAIGALSFFAMSSSQVLGGLFQKRLSTGMSAFADVMGRAILFAGAPPALVK